MPCVHCNIETHKYKCSKCLNYCCSFDCYKSHEASDACSRLQPKHSAGISRSDEQRVYPSRHSTPFSTEDTVDPNKLVHLAKSEALKDLLKNKHLRQILLEIDSTDNASRAMRAAMMEPLFVEFADECLKVVEPST